MKKYLLGLLAVSLAIVTLSFTSNPTKFAAGYRYNSSSSDPLQVKNVSANWTYSTNPAGCSAGADLPCTFNWAQQNDVAFQTHLNTLGTVPAITDAATTKKE